MTRTRSYRFVLAGSALWCLTIIGAPLFSAQPIYELFSRICHQIPERSWHLFGAQLPVCIRCTAIYAGFLFGTLMIRRPNLIFLKLAATTTLVQFLIEIAVVDYSWPRAVTGLALGFAVAPFVVQGFGEMLEKRLTRSSEVVRESM